MTGNACVKCKKRAGYEFNNGTEYYQLKGKCYCSLNCFYETEKVKDTPVKKRSKVKRKKKK